MRTYKRAYSLAAAGTAARRSAVDGSFAARREIAVPVGARPGRRIAAGRESGNALLLAATAMGGSFGSGRTARFRTTLLPVRAVSPAWSRAWPTNGRMFSFASVDLDRRESADELADALLAELGDTDGPIEIGYRASGASRCIACPAPLEE